MKSVLWWVIATMQATFVMGALASGFLILFQPLIDPAAGPASAFVSVLPMWPILLGSMALSIALRWVQGHLAEERQ